MPDKAKEARETVFSDPLLLDLDGDGIGTVGFDAEIRFDHDGNGFKDLTGWVGAGDGMLVLDANGNNKLDNGRELFGDFMILPTGMRAANGFQALAYYDSNSDGKIDANDPIWSRLRIWQSDSYMGGWYMEDPDESGRLTSLDEAGLAAIFVDSTITNITDDAGNTESRTGRFEWQDGTTGSISEYNLERYTADTTAAGELDGLGRSMQHLVSVVTELNSRGIGLRSLRDGAIDTTTASGELIFNIFAALAQFEAELIRERTRAGLSAARTRGRNGGRKPVAPESPKVKMAKKMHEDQSLSPMEKCSTLQISRATYYGYPALG
ncbi:MAG: recombinase family protein [Pseudomonadota bacterium]